MRANAAASCYMLLLYWLLDALLLLLNGGGWASCVGYVIALLFALHCIHHLLSTFVLGSHLLCLVNEGCFTVKVCLFLIAVLLTCKVTINL
jgi:hypothetical protein